MSGIRILACIVLCNLFLSVNVPLCFADAVDMANNGMKAYKAGDKKKAKILLKSALKSNELSKENYIIVNNQLCDVLQSELENKKAVDCYSESLYLDPDNPEALIGRGMLYYDMGLTQRALEDLTLYTQVSPKDPNGFIKKGLAYRELSNYDQAISDLSHAVWLRPQNADVYIHRGKTYVKARNYNLALADFEKAMKFAPENPYTYEAMAWFYAACPNNDFRDGTKAVQFAKKAVELTLPDSPDPVFSATLAAAYAESGLFGQAIESQIEAMTLVKKNSPDFDMFDEEFKRRLELYERGESL